MFTEIQIKQFHKLTGKVTVHPMDNALIRAIALHNGNLSAAEVRECMNKGLRVNTPFNWYQGV